MEKFPSYDDACRRKCFNLRVLTSRIANKKWVGIKANFLLRLHQCYTFFYVTQNVRSLPSSRHDVADRQTDTSLLITFPCRCLQTFAEFDTRFDMIAEKYWQASDCATSANILIRLTHIVTTLHLPSIAEFRRWIKFGRSARLINFTSLHAGIFSRPLIIRAATEENQNANHAWLFVSEIVQRHRRQMMVINGSLVAEVRIE